MLKAKRLEDSEEFGIRGTPGAHLAYGVGVDDLLTKGTAGEIGALGDVEDGVERGLVDGTAVYGPETAENSEEGRLATAVGAHDK